MRKVLYIARWDMTRDTVVVDRSIPCELRKLKRSMERAAGYLDL
jgi:hypothetical protein